MSEAPASRGVLILVLLGACAPAPEPPTSSAPTAYSFFVAGHVYGRSGVDNPGVHPPFKARFDRIRQHPGMAFGVLTGDVVIEPTPRDWDDVDRDLAELGLPIHIAPGNHDLRDVEIFEARYGPPFYAFEVPEDPFGDLFLVLAPRLDAWNVTGEQLALLRRAVEEVESGTRNPRHVFLFFHQLLWWSPENRFRKIEPNWKVWRDPEINFWTEVVPLLRRFERPAYLFAGDLNGRHNPMYARDGDLHFVASGMGGAGRGAARDNFLLVDVHVDGGVSFGIVPLEQQSLDWRLVR